MISTLIMLAGFTGVVTAVRAYAGPPYDGKRELDEMDFDRR
jgi:hypothetical protein